MSSARLQGADPVMIAGVQDTLDDRLIVRPNIKSDGGTQRKTHRRLPFWIGRRICACFTCSRAMV